MRDGRYRNDVASLIGVENLCAGNLNFVTDYARSQLTFTLMRQAESAYLGKRAEDARMVSICYKGKTRGS
jgi:hypothetical protein